MGLTDAVQEGLTEAVTQDASYVAASAVWLSLHSADPGMTGANEVTSGILTAGRQLVTFTGADGTDANVGPISIVLTAETVTWIGYWDSQTGGTFIGGFPLVGLGSTATAISGNDSLISPNHGLAVNDTVRMFPLVDNVASAVAAGFTADTVYYVVAVPDVSHLSLSATMGGSAITPTSSAACGMFVDEGEYAVTGTLNFPAGTGITYITTS